MAHGLQRRLACGSGGELVSTLSAKRARWRRCVYCGVRCEPTRDHVRPLVLGGLDQVAVSGGVTNILPACSPCNRAKGGMPWERWLAQHPDLAGLEERMRQYTRPVDSGGALGAGRCARRARAPFRVKPSVRACVPSKSRIFRGLLDAGHGVALRDV